MSERNIWTALRTVGLSEAGTAAVMGNLYCESLLKATNVEDRSGIADDVYTANVDNGTYSRSVFIRDSYGYGLAQWTWWERKADMYDTIKGQGKSIGDEEAQVNFLIKEMKRSYPDLLDYLKKTTDLYTGTDRFCKEFERPLVNNVAARYSQAQRIFEANKGADVSVTIVQPVVNYAVYSERQSARMPVLAQGAKGVAVGMAQFALSKQGYPVGEIDCDFGPKMLTAVNGFKAARGINNVGGNSGKITSEVWEALYR